MTDMRYEREDFEEYALRSNGSSYVVTLPPSFGQWAESQDVEELTVFEAGSHVVVRPSETTDIESTQSLSVPSDLPVDDPTFVTSFLENVVQSYCIAGADEIDVDIPSEFDTTAEDAIESAFRNIEIDQLLEWDRFDHAFHVEGELAFDRYVEKVVRFLNDYLIRPLSTGSITIANPEEIHRNEERIDRYWALVTRSLGRSFLGLDRNRFPEALCGIYLGKYLELLVDSAVRLIARFNTFADRYAGQPELVKTVQNDLRTMFCGDGISAEPFDEQVKSVAARSYALDIGLDDLEHQYNVADARSKPLDRLGSVPQAVETEQFSTERAFECGRLLGEIRTVCKRLVGFPRSMAFIGLGARNVASVHGIQD